MALNIYEPQRFRSQGIEDLATEETLTIYNGKISVKTVEAGNIAFAGNSFSDVENKGLQWNGGGKSRKLSYKKGTLWTDLSVNLAEEQEFQINDTSVLSFTELGNTVTKSNLKQLGTLKSLKVSGNAELGDFVFINSDFNRIGINTDAPGAALGIRDNGIEIGIGSGKNNSAIIGTFTNHSIQIVSDNVARITVSTNGDVRVHGKLIVDDLVTENTPWMLFKETAEKSNYGKGIMWVGLSGPNKQFCLQAAPDRIWSTEHIDLAKDKFYAIENINVLSVTKLGNTVTSSNLTSVGVLTGLQVAGDAAIARKLSTSQIEIGRFQINENELKVQDELTVSRNENVDLTIGTSIVIGNSNNLTRPVSVYGQLAVGVSNPEAGVSLTVNGPVSFENKKFTVGTGAPTSGQYNKGDIVWNNDPKASDYIGWVCVTPGTPGAWLTFGAIARQ